MGKVALGARHSRGVVGSFPHSFGAHSCQDKLLVIRYRVLPNWVLISRE